MARPGVDPQFADPRNFDGYWPPDWEARQALVVRRDDWSCTNCDTTDEPEKIATIPEQPIEQGGSFELSNLITLCEDCKNEFEQSTPTEHEQSQPSHQSEPETNRSASQTPDSNSKPTGEDSHTQSDTQEDPQRDQGRRNATPERIKQENHQAAPKDDPTDYGRFGRAIIAFAVGTTMFAAYLFSIALFVVLTSDTWTTLAVLILPLGGALLGTRYPLSTVLAVGYLIGFVGIILAVVPLPPDADGAWFLFGEPVVIPLLGVAYGLLADHYEFSLLEEVPRSQILD
jgi:hypothetical protein